jgi:hypothetical protein
MTLFLKYFVQDDLPFVELYRLNKFEFNAPIYHENEKDVSNLMKKVSTWNCDGEVMKTQSIRIK